jgi:hypothetical protein
MPSVSTTMIHCHVPWIGGVTAEQRSFHFRLARCGKSREIGVAKTALDGGSLDDFAAHRTDFSLVVHLSNPFFVKTFDPSTHR